MRSTLLWVVSVFHISLAQRASTGSDKGFLFNRRPLLQQQQSAAPCWSGGGGGGGHDIYDQVNEDERGRKLFLAAGAAIGGAALGYHLGMKHQNQPIINNHIYNELPSPCVVVQGGGGGSWSGSSSGSGGLLGHHPILSNLLQNGLGGGGLLSGHNPLGGGGGGLLGGSGPLGGGLPLGGSSSSATSIASGGGLVNRQSTINWNRAIRQFNRVIRPITRGF